MTSCGVAATPITNSTSVQYAVRKLGLDRCVTSSCQGVCCYELLINQNNLRSPVRACRLLVKYRQMHSTQVRKTKKQHEGIKANKEHATYS